MFEPAPAEEPQATPLADAFISLRSRWETARDWPLVAEPFEVEAWMAMLSDLMQDVFKSRFTWPEVTHQ